MRDTITSAAPFATERMSVRKVPETNWYHGPQATRIRFARSKQQYANVPPRIALMERKSDCANKFFRVKNENFLACLSSFFARFLYLTKKQWERFKEKKNPDVQKILDERINNHRFISRYTSSLAPIHAQKTPSVK